MEIKPVMYLAQPRKKFQSELVDKQGGCISIETHLEITVGGVQCYGLRGVCEEGYGGCEIASRTMSVCDCMLQR
jgi:hypothetical protein